MSSENLSLISTIFELFICQDLERINDNELEKSLQNLTDADCRHANSLKNGRLLVILIDRRIPITYIL